MDFTLFSELTFGAGKIYKVEVKQPKVPEMCLSVKIFLQWLFATPLKIKNRQLNDC
jgi:hypothetical protein